MTRTTTTTTTLTLTAFILSGTVAFGEVPGNQPNGDGPGSISRAKFQSVDLGTLGGPNSAALGMNDRGTVVGWSDTGDPSSFSINSTPPGQHAYVYRDGLMFDLGTLGGSWSEARAVNSRNQVVGASDNASGEQRAFYSYDLVMIDLNGLLRNAIQVGAVPGELDRFPGVHEQPGDQSVQRPILFAANAINNEGHIVACGTLPPDEAIHAFLLIPVDATDLERPRYDFIEIGQVGADPPPGFSIGNSGQVPAQAPPGGNEPSPFNREGFGAFGTGNQPALRPDPIGDALNDWSNAPPAASVTAFMDLLIDMGGTNGQPQQAAAPGNQPSGDVGDVPAPPAHDCIGLGLNDADLVVGAMDEVAFVWDAFDLDHLESPQTQTQSQANAINFDGVVVGWSSIAGSRPTATLWAEGDGILLHAVKGSTSEANDINDAELVVGWSQDLGGAPVAMLWTPAQTVDLNTVTLFPAAAQFQITLEDATAIDESGRIAGVGRRPDGTVRAFLLVPLN